LGIWVPHTTALVNKIERRRRRLLKQSLHADPEKTKRKASIVIRKQFAMDSNQGARSDIAETVERFALDG